MRCFSVVILLHAFPVPMLRQFVLNAFSVFSFGLFSEVVYVRVCFVFFCRFMGACVGPKGGRV